MQLNLTQAQSLELDDEINLMLDVLRKAHYTTKSIGEKVLGTYQMPIVRETSDFYEDTTAAIFATLDYITDLQKLCAQLQERLERESARDTLTVGALPHWFTESRFKAFAGRAQLSEDERALIRCTSNLCEQAYARGYEAALTSQKQAG